MVSKTNQESVTTETNGRDEKGRFGAGNSFGGGSNVARRAAGLRRTLMDATSEEEVVRIWGVLKEMALDGDLPAIKEFLDRMIGKSVPVDENGHETGGISIAAIDHYFGVQQMQAELESLRAERVGAN